MKKTHHTRNLQIILAEVRAAKANLEQGFPLIAHEILRDLEIMIKVAKN